VFDHLRGEGLMLGLKCHVPVGDVATAARREGLLTIPAGDSTLRVLPPLVATDEDLRQAADRLDSAASALESTMAGGGVS
jgi:acetylornithine/N-succinyldiaminopimelate aminotransferase